jgi:hypothetical protein
VASLWHCSGGQLLPDQKEIRVSQLATTPLAGLGRRLMAALFMEMSQIWGLAMSVENLYAIICNH